MKYYETKEFLTLQRQRKKKLKASGFKDIERNEMQLSVYSCEVMKKLKSENLDYYSKAQDFLLQHTFHTKLEQFIWKNHVDGLSLRKIASILETHELFPPLKKDSIRGHIERMEAIMLKKTA